MCNVELLIAEPAEFVIGDEMVHIAIRSGAEPIMLAMPVLTFRGTIAQAQVELWKYDEAQKNVVPIGAKRKR